MDQTAAAVRVSWRGVIVFLLLAFGLTWIPFLILQSNTNPVVQVLILLLQFVPAIAAALVRGPLLREGFADSGLQLNFRRRQSVSTYAYSLLLLPLLFVGAIVFGLLLHLATWAPQASQTSGVLPLGLNGLPLPSSVLSIVVVVFALSIVGALVTFGEEFGWRGYLLPRLMPLGQNWAILLSGVIWACWHLPLNLLYGVNGGLQGFPFWLVWTIGLGAVLGWLRLRAQSVWPAAIMHAQVDTLPRLEGVLLAPTVADPVFVILQLLVILLGIVLALRKSLTYWWLRDSTGTPEKLTEPDATASDTA
jgi:membrane protease YdiL (CAAX protease family)